MWVLAQLFNNMAGLVDQVTSRWRADRHPLFAAVHHETVPSTCHRRRMSMKDGVGEAELSPLGPECARPCLSTSVLAVLFTTIDPEGHRGGHAGGDRRGGPAEEIVTEASEIATPSLHPNHTSTRTR